ncbi:MAG TPA: membrane protein insertase YidC [Ohtaekwangia sp.]|nr:membrane protein insertase YidC [Ohtaekwangia sp.]
MDRNSAIGLTLIAVLLLAYFYWFSPTAKPPVQQPAQVEAPATAPKEAPAEAEVPDSTLAANYGGLSAAMKGQETFTTIETKDIRIIFSSKGGTIQELELKNYKTYTQKPLKLITAETNQFQLLTQYQGKPVDLYSLYYQANETTDGDTTRATFTARLADGNSVVQTYSIPKEGFEIGYQINASSIAGALGGDNLTFHWNNTLKPVEKDLTDTRNHSTITYYSEEDGFSELSETSTSTETEIISTPLKWMSIKEKFFLASIISAHHFAGGEFQTSLNPNDTSVVKQANVKLLIPKKSVADGNANFKFYIGPNDYQVIGKVAEDFARNVYLGWKPVYWINKFVIFPVFHFLTLFISNYGLIIIILVILLKLVLFPLSYKSFLSMAKMKVLKPDLDEIKARVGDDMTKVQQEQLKLYQQVGVNPISGCIPVLLQMPILFAMFYLFPNSIELRQQPFLWAEDLSAYDSAIRFSFTVPFLGNHISLFTVLMTAATLIYTWQNNQISSVTGPMKSMSYIMPVIFLFVLNSFPAGLTFYYFVSTLITFIQQAIIKKFVDEDKIKAIMEENRKKNAAGGGTKKSKFMSKLEDAMKASEEARRKADEERKKRKG